MKLELRRHIEEIMPLSIKDFDLIAPYFVPQRFTKGEFVFRQGDKVPYTYFVVSGLLKLLYSDASGKEHILSFAMEDWWETDYYAFYQEGRATMSLRCLEDTEVLHISLEDYHNLCGSFPRMEHFFLQKAISGHIASQQRILSLLGSSAEERYAMLLKRYPSLIQRVSKSQMAAFLGVSRETLSRFYS
ncbi:Crp/Fnr family transcriptional regulator [Muricauda oceani]|uniref:Crp/Fnr family transcriptional regulator n=1 Tax=Flagellimonas oceani TaxID=2698672 RepID=A0A6G7IZ88_9FLAO|nr:Crp/Fnr family transcriptional regulator [Allomuricauda oceani]MBW8243718.1 Crp/Fnr family transcriptional regulator [Allomuricauda oceani]QII43923.1 Crp/Fnr family transcriptional regulator [Allomuricauda oceani]